MQPVLANLLSRRNLLRQSAAIPGMLGATAFLSQQSLAETVAGATPAGCHFAPRAKRVIHLFMNGGPFHGDLFDPKPALAKYAGQRPSGTDLVTERPTGGLLASPYRFQP